jgi:signal transduction histidine kinase
MLAALAAAWVLLAAWQWQEFCAERKSARDALSRQADSIMNALVGGIQSHRRFGRFLEEQLQSALDELAKSEDLVAVGFFSADRRLAVFSGQTPCLDRSTPFEPGQFWDETGFRYAVSFHLSAETPGMGGGLGRGLGGGGGWGRGRVGPSRTLPDQDPLDSGGTCFAVLVLDRTGTDENIAHYAWMRLFVTIAGGLVILSVALAWRTTIRLAESRGQARLLEIESRHLRDLSQAAAGLAHETRNPLGLIRGWTQRWAQSLGDNLQQRRQVEAVIEECDRVTARINQFLAFARPCEPKKTAVCPADVATELMALLEPDLQMRGITLRANMPGPTILADREMLRQAFFNYLQNAIQFSPPGATVEICQKAWHNGAMRIEVADRGAGVSAEAIDRLFTPYHTTRADGTGLGLAIVRRIAVAHGWEAGYAPRAGGGSIFWLDTAPLPSGGCCGPTHEDVASPRR